jgi:hypothetical protein
VGVELFHAGGRTDGRDETNGRVSQFCLKIRTKGKSYNEKREPNVRDAELLSTKEQLSLPD